MPKSVAIALVVTLLVITALLLVRRRALRSVAEGWRRQHPVGADGVVPGAAPLALDANVSGVANGEQEAGCRARRAALLLHGFGDTPQSLARQAQALHARGWTVRVPLLPGHGRSLEAFRASDAAQWTAAVRHAYRPLCQTHDAVVVIGLSMGGALATSLAATPAAGEEGNGPWRAPAALVLLAPYLSVSLRGRLLTAFWPLWSLVRDWIPGSAAASIRDPGARARSLGYGVSTPRLLRELRRVVDAAHAAAPRLRCPALMICSTADYRVPREAAQRAFNRLGSADKQLVWVERSGHIITVDHDADRVTELVLVWLDRAGDTER